MYIYFSKLYYLYSHVCSVYLFLQTCIYNLWSCLSILFYVTILKALNIFNTVYFSMWQRWWDLFFKTVAHYKQWDTDLGWLFLHLSFIYLSIL